MESRVNKTGSRRQGFYTDFLGIFQRRTGKGSVFFLICCLIVFIILALRSGRGFVYTTVQPEETDTLSLASGEVCTQALPSGNRTIRALLVRFGTLEEKEDEDSEGEPETETGEPEEEGLNGSLSEQNAADNLLTVSFWKNGEMVRQWVLDTSMLTGKEYQVFEFDHPLRMKEKDICSFTVVQENQEGRELTLWMTKSVTEAVDGAAQLSDTETENDGNMSVCCRLTLQDNGARISVMIPFIFGLLVLSLAFAVLYDFDRVSVPGILLTLLLFFLIQETFTSDLLRLVNREIPVRPYSWEGEAEKIGPGEKWEDSLAVKRADFTELKIPVGKEAGSSTSFRIIITGEDSESILLDQEYGELDFVGGGPTGRAVRIKASDTEVGKYFPRGVYRIQIINQDDSSNLKIVLQEDAEGKEILNFLALRSSRLGYGLACAVFLLLTAYVLSVLIYLRRYSFTAEGFFLVSGVPLVIIYLILMLPWSPPDAGSHILATYRFSNILLGTEESSEWTGREDDAVLFPDAWKTGGFDEKHNPNMREYAEIFLNGETFVKNSGKAEIGRDDRMLFYSPVNYFPQIAGVTLGRILRLGPVQVLYLGRIMALIAYMAGCFHAIHLTPIGKTVFASIALLPVSLMISSSISYDVMVIIATLCFIASVLKACCAEDSKAPFIESAIWAAALGSIKGGGYLILLPIAFMFVLRNFDRNRFRASMFSLLAILLAGGLSVLIFDLILPSDGLYQFGGDQTGYLAFSYALANPGNYLDKLLGAFVHNADTILLGTVGTRLGWAEAVIPNVVIAALMAVIAVFSLFERDRLSLTSGDRRIILLILIVFYLGLPTMLLCWTPLGSDMIMGIQGRYYLPVIPLLIILLTKGRISGLEKGGFRKEFMDRESRLFMLSFCALSCISVYYMMSTYLTR